MKTSERIWTLSALDGPPLLHHLHLLFNNLFLTPPLLGCEGSMQEKKMRNWRNRSLFVHGNILDHITSFTSKHHQL